MYRIQLLNVLDMHYIHVIALHFIIIYSYSSQICSIYLNIDYTQFTSEAHMHACVVNHVYTCLCTEHTRNNMVTTHFTTK